MLLAVIPVALALIIRLVLRKLYPRIDITDGQLLIVRVCMAIMGVLYLIGGSIMFLWVASVDVPTIVKAGILLVPALLGVACVLIGLQLFRLSAFGERDKVLMKLLNI